MSDAERRSYLEFESEISADDDGDLTIEIYSKDNRRRALIGVGFKDEIGDWYSMISMEESTGVLPVVDWRETIDEINKWLRMAR